MPALTFTYINWAMNKKYRLMFYGGASIKNRSHNNTFHAAALNVARDWNDRDGEKRRSGEIILKSFAIESGANIVKEINGHPKGSIASIDFFSHGSPYGLWFGHREERCYVFFSCTEKQNLYRSERERRLDEGGDHASSWEMINHAVFTEDARVEFHGCNTGAQPMNNSLAGYISEALFKAGKKKAYVIGHGDYSNPDRPMTEQEKKLYTAKQLNVAKTTDYRHGLRRVVHDGTVLHQTRAVGHLEHDVIQKLLP